MSRNLLKFRTCKLRNYSIFRSLVTFHFHTYYFIFWQKNHQCFLFKGLLTHDNTDIAVGILDLIQVFLCRLPFWQRHIVLAVSQKTCHHLKIVFDGSYVLKHSIELKSINPKNSVCLSLSLYIYIYICHNFQVNIFPAGFVQSFLKNSYLPEFWC